jgi:membrane associated rhomboid family serine protease
MGIYDREYYRREGPSFLGSLTNQGKACNWLLALNIVCFILQMVTRPEPSRGHGSGDGPFTDWFILNTELVREGQVWRLLTYAFLHSTGSLWHIVINMALLWWFGRLVEGMLGSREFVLVYLVSAVVAGVAYFASVQVGLHGDPRLGHSALGASGAVMAILVLAACYYPRQIIYLFFVLPMPIWAFVILYVCLDAFKLLGGGSGGVATSAHLGGAAFGFIYYKLGWRLSGWLRLPQRSRPRLRLYREDDVGFVPASAKTPPPPAPRPDDEHLEAQVDAILAKIPRVGMEGLTDQERQVLLRASEAIKRRRG